MRMLAGVLILAAGAWAAAGEAGKAAKVTELPCPDPKPTFDYTRIDRSLKEPAYGGGKQAYRFLAFGPEGKTIVAMVVDASEADPAVYIDLNANHDTTEPGERFALAGPVRLAPSQRGPGGVTVGLSGQGGKPVLARTRLAVPDETFDYYLSVQGSVQVDTVAKDGSWRIPLHMYSPGSPWSTSREEAPVYRFGGGEFHLRNEDFAQGAEGARRSAGGSVGQRLPPGTMISVDAVTGFFAGSSPAVAIGNGGSWPGGGVPGLKAYVESVADPNTPRVWDIAFYGY